MSSELLNISSIVSRKLCLGCGTCNGVCPTDAITMIYSSKNRTYIPVVDKERCISCSICYKVCPGIHVILPKTQKLSSLYGSKISPEFGEYLKCYIGHATENRIRYEASSGGIATALSIFLLKSKKVDGVVGISMRDISPFETEPQLIQNCQAVKNIMGSKYCPAASNSIIKNINTTTCNSLLFTGLPCHIQGLNNAKMYNPLKEIKNIITIGIFCGGMRGQEGSDWILKKNKIQKTDVKSIKSHRGNGWPGGMVIILKNGSKITIPYPSGIVDEVFESWQPWRCFLCLDKSSELADISIGDAWGFSSADNNEGLSLVIARTQKGLQVLEDSINNNIIQLTEITSESIIKSQIGLWTDIDKTNKPANYLSKLLGIKRPEYGIPISNPGIKVLYNLLKKLIKFYIYRKFPS